MKHAGYIVKRADRAAEKVKVGTTVYDCMGHDYGLAADDTRETGIDHVSVTLNEDGEYPFFTIPREDLWKVTEPEGRVQ